MAYTTINKSGDNFDAKIYTGNGSSQTLTMDNLGLLWMKNRTETSNYNLFDVVRGGHYTSAPGPNLRTNSTTSAHGSDITSAYGITFGSSSSTIGSDGGGYNYNQSGKSYVGWQWRANGTGSSNTDGSITSTVSANATAGFSIVSWTGDGSDATIGHGLSSAPKLIIHKHLSGSVQWNVYHASAGTGGYLRLDSTSAFSSNSGFFGTAPTSTVFSPGSHSYMSGSGNDNIAYCFAEKTGYSKFGKFTSNGNDNGAFIHTGFAPKWVMLKPNVTDGWSHWYIFDTARDHPQLNDMPLYANLTTQEGYYGGSPASDYAQIDLLSNGFKIRKGSGWGAGGSGREIIYMAFGQSIVGTNNVPATAR